MKDKVYQMIYFKSIIISQYKIMPRINKVSDMNIQHLITETDLAIKS